MAPGGRRPGGGGVGRLRLGGDDRAGTVPGSAWGGTTGRGQSHPHRGGHAGDGEGVRGCGRPGDGASA